MQATKTDTHGFNVEKELDLLDWCNLETEGVDEYVHAVPDISGRKLHLYRSVGEPGENRRMKTTISNVKFRLNTNESPKNWYLTYGEAFSLITFCNLLAKERTPATVTFNHYGDNGKKLTEGETLTEESIILEYRTESGRERQTHINKVYRTQMQMMANW